MIALATIGTWFWFDGASVDARHYLLMGAAFPLLFKSAVPAVADQRVTAGANASALRDYFRIGRPS
jgi:hypothetical protein